MHNSFVPLFRSLLKSKVASAPTAAASEKAAKEGGLAVVAQKLSELELSLYNIKQNVQIEDVVLE